MKKCPFCAEQIQSEAVVCRYCGRQLGFDSIFPSAPHPIGNDSMPDFSSVPPYYQDEFRRIYESGERYKGKWNWAAFCGGIFWACYRGLWLSAIVAVVASLLTYGVGGFVFWILWSARGNYLCYCTSVKAVQRVL